MNLDNDVIIHFFDLQSKTQQISYTILEENEIIFTNFPFKNSHANLLSYFKKEKLVDFFITEDFLIIGYLRSSVKDLEIIIGPASISLSSEEDLNKLLSKMSNKWSGNKNDLLNSSFNIPYIPLESFLNMICTANCFINQEIIYPQNLLTRNIDTSLLEVIQKQVIEFDSENVYLKEHTNSINYEAQLYYCVREGDIDAMNSLLESFSDNLGKLGPNSLRHYKNAVIILNSLTLRAAISAGIDSDICYRLGGLYIKKIEKTNSFDDLKTICYTMVNDYCKRVKLLKISRNNLNQIADVEINKCLNYVADNFRDKLSIADIAQNIGYSPEYLSSKFKKVTGKNLPHYINEKKIEDAQKKLVLTELSISEISDQLSFSNQSYFQKIFKNIVGITPLNYRKQNSIIKKNEI
ncbi:helix-turn-helix domain-containing protein [Enterococcus sp. AZ196]|uniref:helix-turn-helix domain-containing protein n=1 Tax=Enterococcus sp. AZ196 TaxID=2774659 RepID=UPI003D2B29A6